MQLNQQLIGGGHVGHHTHLAAVVGQTFVEDVHRGGLKHRRIQGTVDQQALRHVKAAAVLGADVVLVHVQAILACQSGTFA